MNSKRSVYLLLPLVLLVWGLIGWRIWAASDPVAEGRQLAAATLRTRPAPARRQPVLLLTYGDPFKPGLSRPGPPPAVPQPTPNAFPKPAPEPPKASLNFTVRPAPPAAAVASVTWPQIKYLGVIARAGSNAQVALLTIDNQELVVKAGKSERGVQVFKLFRDSVQLGFGGQKKSFLRGSLN